MLGADHTIDIEAMPDPAERLALVRDWTDGIGPDVVLDCTGYPTATIEGLELARRGGRLFVIGQFSERGSVPLRPELITFGEVRVQGSRGFTAEDIFRYLRSIEMGLERYPIERVISHRFGLDEADRAMATVKRGESVRAVFAP
jgi:5-exo-hydroxycamphor dehydrogenase